MVIKIIIKVLTINHNVTEEVEQVVCLSETQWLNPHSSSLRVEVSLGKKPKLLPLDQLHWCVNVCVYEFLMSKFALCREATCRWCVNVCVNG